MEAQVPAPELAGRLERIRARLDQDDPCWEMAAVFGSVNRYYLAGTLQDGVLVVPRDGEATLWVRRSHERACRESLFPDIRPMRSFREVAAGLPTVPRTVHLETDVVPIGLYERFRKHVPVSSVRPLDRTIARVRAIKTPYELACLERAGMVHRRVLEERVPALLREGCSEADFGAAVYAALVEEGHDGLVRFGAFGTEIVVGQLGFGDSSLQPTAFDGPGGCQGIGPAAPVLGSREVCLQAGHLVFLDCACMSQGYQTDRTMTYVFQGELPPAAVEAHERCLALEHSMAAVLRPGVTPAEVYEAAIAGLEPAFLEHFMGFGARRAGFLGHGTGLQVDEWPVIAPGFDEPLEEGMVIALEPKKGVPGIGMVGSENTYLVTLSGGCSLTGNHPGLLPVP